jgi:hypothetical protein
MVPGPVSRCLHPCVYVTNLLWVFCATASALPIASQGIDRANKIKIYLLSNRSFLEKGHYCDDSIINIPLK